MFSLTVPKSIPLAVQGNALFFYTILSNLSCFLFNEWPWFTLKFFMCHISLHLLKSSLTTIYMKPPRITNRMLMYSFSVSFSTQKSATLPFLKSCSYLPSITHSKKFVDNSFEWTGLIISVISEAKS